MTEFKLGDKVRSKDGIRRPGTITVLAVHERYLWLGDNGTPWTVPAIDWEVIPDFFEEGHTYRGVQWPAGVTFDCHAIIYVGALENKDRWAVGQRNTPSGPVLDYHPNFEDFEEV